MMDVFKAYGLPTDEEYNAQARECDAALERAADCARRHRGDDVVYKTIEQPIAAQTRPVMSMSEAKIRQDAEWNTWFSRSFEQHAEDFAGFLGKVVGEVMDEERQRMREHVASELRKLRDELRPPEDDKVLEWPRKHNAA